MLRSTLTRGTRLHRPPDGTPGAAPVAQAARARVLARIRRALADGDEAGALRVARELERRFEAARVEAWGGARGGARREPARTAQG
ncbi:MAG: hypothetical protein R3F35_20485 [Myxococcota bacterium]